MVGRDAGVDIRIDVDIDSIAVLIGDSTADVRYSGILLRRLAVSRAMDAVLDHTMMRVEDLETSVDWYMTHLDYEEKGRMEADTFTNVFLGPEQVHEQGAVLELTYNHDDRSYDVGDAWGHVAVRVGEDELQSSYDELMNGGVDDYRDPESCDYNYAFVKDPDGHEIEIIKRDYGERWSLDHTMTRVEDADETIGFWTRKFEYETQPEGKWEADSFANYFVAPRDSPKEAMSVELTYNYDGRSYDVGDAWGHVAVRVDDLDDAWDTLMTREAEDYRDPESCDHNYAFTKDPDGHEIEIVRR
jgi:lactoylglutathione lyase